MNKSNISKAMNIVLSIIVLLLITIGLSFAYFTANLTGVETSTTITVIGGSMNIHYEGGASINMNNIYPRSEVWATKTFTVTGNNTTHDNMIYSAILVVEENGFSSGALKYKLTSTNTDSNGEVIPSITDYKNILRGEREVYIGTGFFNGQISNKVHTYNLELYFPDSGVNQNQDQGKIFRGYVKMISGNYNEIPEYYVLATDEDFETITIENWIYDEVEDNWYQDGYIYVNQYKGTDEYVIIPEYINGNLVTSAYGMFGLIWDYDEESDEDFESYASPVKGVATTNNNITDMTDMFSYNESTSLELKYLDTSNVTDMSYMFEDNKATSLDLSSFDTSKVVDMYAMFRDNHATSVDLSSFDTSNVVDMDSMFYYSEATSLDLSSFNTSNVTNMNSMFYATQATSIDLNSFNTSKVTDMSYMFYESQTTSLDLSTFDTSNVIDMYCMFYYSKATNINLSSFNTSKVNNMSHMFAKSQTTSLDLSSFNTSNVTDMYGMFFDNQATSLDLSSFNTSNVTDMNSMFYGSQATSIDLSSFNTSNLTNMNSMFYDSQVTSLDLRSFNTSKVTDMSSMFSGCQATSLDLSSFNTSKVTDMSFMFRYNKVINLDLSSFDTTNVTTTTSMFRYSIVTTIYARTQADANKFNSSSNKPAGLTFVLK